MKLSEFVRHVRTEKKLSLKDIEKRSGGNISSGYINQIENGSAATDSISLEKLRALSKGLGVPEGDIIRVARGLPPETSRFEIYAEAFDAELDESEWQFLEKYFRDQVDQYVAIKTASKAQAEKQNAKSKGKKE